MNTRKRVTVQASSRIPFGIGAATVTLLLLVVSLVGTGCAGGSEYRVDEPRIARSYLSTEANVPSHPDSLTTVSIQEEENTIDIEIDRSYNQLMRDWSSTWTSQGSGRASRSSPYRSFATLWSLDLSVASLVAEEGVEGLSKDLALERIDNRREEHQQTIQIDLYRFVGSPPTGGGINSTLVGRPGSRITLQDDEGNEYRPERVENSPPREGAIAGEQTVYRRNTFVFRREVDGRDILGDTRTLRLYINQSIGDRYYFTWSWEDHYDAADTSP